MQKLKPGDKVRFVDENLEGIITSDKGNEIYAVTIEGDFEIPSHGSKLIKIAFNATQTKDVLKEDYLVKKSNNPIGIFAAYNRLSDDETELLVYNNFADKVHLVCYAKETSVYRLLHSEIIPFGNYLTVGNYKITNFATWPPLHFEFLCAEPITAKIPMPVYAKLDINSTTFHRSLKYCFFLNKQAYTFNLIDQPAEKAMLEKLKNKDFSEPAVIPKPNLSKRPEEIIDLHYDALKAAGFAPTNDIVSLQMDVFTKSLEAAFKHQIKQIVFIHGTGTEYLKNKIHTYLKNQKDIVLDFGMADQLKFGSSATYVKLK